MIEVDGLAVCDRSGCPHKARGVMHVSLAAGATAETKKIIFFSDVAAVWRISARGIFCSDACEQAAR